MATRATKAKPVVRPWWSIILFVGLRVVVALDEASLLG